MRVPYPPGQQLKSALGVWNHRNGMFLLLDTDEGITGIGEIWSNFPQWSHLEKEASVHQGLKPLVLGADPLDIEKIWNTAGQTFKRICLQWGAPGIAYQILSGLDLALWDICGKMNRKPINALLNAPLQEIPVYCSGLGPHNVLENAEQFLAQGVRSFKLKIGMDWEQDLRNLAQLRERIGPGCRLMADVNQGWDLETAKKCCPQLEEFDLYWLEEPLMADDVEGLTQLQKSTKLRIAGGENLYGREFERQMSSGMLQVCQPDITKCGGITPLLEIAQTAQQEGVELEPHFFGNGVGCAATLQVMGAVNAQIMEWDYASNPMKDNCVAGLAPICGGCVAMPQGPGLGIELVEEELERYRFVPYKIAEGTLLPQQ